MLSLVSVNKRAVRCKMEMEEECEDGEIRLPCSSQTKLVVMSVFSNICGNATLRWVKLIWEGRQRQPGVSVRSIQHMKNEMKDGRLHSPPAETERSSPVIDKIDQFDEDYIRRQIVSFYTRWEISTEEAVLRRVKESKLCFPGCVTSLWKLIRDRISIQEIRR